MTVLRSRPGPAAAGTAMLKRLLTKLAFSTRTAVLNVALPQSWTLPNNLERAVRHDRGCSLHLPEEWPQTCCGPAAPHSPASAQLGHDGFYTGGGGIQAVPHRLYPGQRPARRMKDLDAHSASPYCILVRLDAPGRCRARHTQVWVFVGEFVATW